MSFDKLKSTWSTVKVLLNHAVSSIFSLSLHWWMSVLVSQMVWLFYILNSIELLWADKTDNLPDTQCMFKNLLENVLDFFVTQEVLKYIITKK